jgi:hypothetical protein
VVHVHQQFAIDEWDEPTLGHRGRRAVSVTSDPVKNHEAVTKCLELVLELQRNHQLKGASIHIDLDGAARFALEVPPEEVPELRKRWPLALACPELDEPDANEEATVVAMPTPESDDE